MAPQVEHERVLSTLNADGTRRHLAPKLSRGRFLQARRVVGFALVALFVALPFVTIGGRPALLMDLVTRELSLFGAVFRPSDGFLLMLFGLVIVLAVFLVTALFGRVWCGWGCPQTVYLELVFRPIERFVTRRKLPGAVKWAAYAAICFALANVFLAYFVGVDRLATWVLHSPLDHVAGFSLVVGVAGLMLFDFGYFREQMCIVACPYGRLQTVLLDPQSLIVGYDAARGEPRGKPKKRLPVLQARGDCVDCNACVATCPTGIDIREGLQMECIGCAQCIDACDAVMDKLQRPRGLVGYTSQDVLAGKPRRVLRLRTAVYPALLVVVAALLVWGVGTREPTKVWIDRVQGPTFVELPDGQIASQVRLKLENESDQLRTYTLTSSTADAQLRGATLFSIKPRKAFEVSLFVDAPRASYVHGKRTMQLRIVDDHGFTRSLTLTLLGPEGGAL